MNLIDFHCDTLMRLYDIAQHPDSNESLWQITVNRCVRLQNQLYPHSFHMFFYGWRDRV